MAALDFPPGPSNGQQYTFNGVNYYFDATVGAWLTSVVGNPILTSVASVSATTPAMANVGDIWFNTSLSKLFVYYNDGDSSQWVEPSYAAVFPNQAQVNTAFLIANSAFDTANGGYTIANAAFGVANAAYGIANAAFGRANGGYTVANAAFGRANSALQNTTGVFAGTLTATGNVCATTFYGSGACLTGLSGGFKCANTITTTGTWTIPASVTTIRAIVVGGGGGGAGYFNNTCSGGTGGTTCLSSGTQSITTISGGGGTQSFGCCVAGWPGGSGSQGDINLTGEDGTPSFSGGLCAPGGYTALGGYYGRGGFGVPLAGGQSSGGAGAGGTAIKYYTGLVPGSTLCATIGSGGTGVCGGTSGSPGFIVIEY